MAKVHADKGPLEHDLLGRVLKDPEAHRAIKRLRADGFNLEGSTQAEGLVRVLLVIFAFSNGKSMHEMKGLIQKHIKAATRSRKPHDIEVSHLLEVARHVAGESEYAADATALKQSRYRRAKRAASRSLSSEPSPKQ